MRSFTLMAIMAAYVSAVSIKEDTTIAGEIDIQAAVDNIAADVDGSTNTENHAAISDKIDATMNKG